MKYDYFVTTASSISEHIRIVKIYMSQGWLLHENVIIDPSGKNEFFHQTLLKEIPDADDEGQDDDCSDDSED